MLTLLLTAALAQDVPSDRAAFLPDTPASFDTAKRRMYKLHADHQLTLYCGCSYDAKVVDLASCEMTELEDVARARRTEAEHIVPASAFGRTRPCWAEGGRKHCMKVDDVFRAFHNDLHILAPTVGEVNGRRSNYSFGFIAGEERAFGACDFEVESADSKAEAAADVRGDVARVYLYAWTHPSYRLPLSEPEVYLYWRWHLSDPPTEWERTKDRRVEDQQGNHNPFVR